MLLESLIVSYVKDLKIGMRKLFIEKDNKLALIEQFLTEHPALNYNTFNCLNGYSSPSALFFEG